MSQNTIKNPESPHFWWLIGILIVIIIILLAIIITCKVLEPDKIMKGVSNASVLLSITLSIFAILYTYTSNQEIRQQFGKINTVADNITSVSEKLAKTNDDLNKNLETILDCLEKIENTQKEMYDDINKTNLNIDIPDNSIEKS